MSTLSNSADKSSILSRLARLTPDSPRQWGRMSPHQAICHLSDAFRSVMGVRRSAPVDTLVSRTVIRFVALHMPLVWPKGVPTLAESDQERGGTRPVEFARDKRELEALFARFTASPRDFEFSPHPMFGPLTEREWMIWGYRHMDHHLRQFAV